MIIFLKESGIERNGRSSCFTLSSEGNAYAGNHFYLVIMLMSN